MAEEHLTILQKRPCLTIIIFSDSVLLALSARILFGNLVRFLSFVPFCRLPQQPSVTTRHYILFTFFFPLPTAQLHLAELPGELLQLLTNIMIRRAIFPRF